MTKISWNMGRKEGVNVASIHEFRKVATFLKRAHSGNGNYCNGAGACYAWTL